MELGMLALRCGRIGVDMVRTGMSDGRRCEMNFGADGFIAEKKVLRG